MTWRFLACINPYCLWLEQTGNMNIIEMNVYYTSLCDNTPLLDLFVHTPQVSTNWTVLLSSRAPDPQCFWRTQTSQQSHGVPIFKKKHTSLQATIKINGQKIKTTQHALNIIHKSTSLPRTFLQTKLVDLSQDVSRSMLASPMFLWWGKHYIDIVSLSLYRYLYTNWTLVLAIYIFVS